MAPRHLNFDIREDLWTWGKLLDFYNRSLFMEGPFSNQELELFADASGSPGFGAYFQGQLCAERWSEAWRETGLVSSLALPELFLIVVSTVIWSERLGKKKVKFLCDNRLSRPVVSLLRQLVLRGLELNAQFVGVHVPGVINSIEDSLSRFQGERFRELDPGAEVEGIPCLDFGIWFDRSYGFGLAFRQRFHLRGL